MKNIVFTGGGTAGHIMPNLAIINDIKDEYNIFYFGSNGMEKKIISQYKFIQFVEIPSVKFLRNLSPQNLLIPLKMLKNIKIAKQKLIQISPVLIFSKGGYVSIPTCLAGQQLKIPTITHESDLTIGLANKIIAKKSKKICCSFKTTADKFKKNAIFTGSPIRREIFNGKKDIILNRHHIEKQTPIILIVGGSQGAKAINEFIWNNIDNLTKTYQIIHIVGKNNINDSIKQHNYTQIEFAQDIENYFQASDIVISRAGSNTIFELLAIEKPMILIPLPKSKYSRGDQVLNAEYFKNEGLAEILYQEKLEINEFKNVIDKILKNKPQIISKMKKANNYVGNKNIIEIIKNYT